MRSPQTEPRAVGRGLRTAVERVRRHWLGWLIAVIATLGIAITGLGVWLASSTTDKWYDALWLEIAKAGVQVVAVGVLGGALAAAWQAITAQREQRLAQEADKESERSERNAKIRGELADLVVLYNDVKAVRRTLRSLGLDAKLYARAEAVHGQSQAEAEAEAQEQREQVKRAICLTIEQANGLHEQMRILNRLQLGYESKVRQFEQADLLGEDTATVREQLEVVETYLNGVLALWEKRGWTTREGTQLGVVTDGLDALFRQRHFRPGIKKPMREITRLINKHLFGAPALVNDLSSRTARQVLDDHLGIANNWVGEGFERILDEDLRRNVAEEIVILNNRGVFRGHEGVRQLARTLAEELPEHQRFEYTHVAAEGRIALLEWSYEDSQVRVRDGADSYLIEGGKIVAQTIHYTVETK